MTKICLIGSSLITSIYAQCLSSSAEVYMYEGKEFGGAWQGRKIGNHTTQVFNNIICPMNSEEEAFIDDIYNLLIEGNADIRIEKDAINLNCNYLPKKYLLGEFHQFIANTVTASNLNIIQKPIKAISISKNRILVNNESYDIILLPENFKVDSIFIDGNRISPTYEEHKSRHFRILFDSPINGPGYTEDFDVIFDRGGMFTPKKSSIFIGRVRRNKKNISASRLMDKSNYLKTINASIEEIQENFYLHSFMLESQKIVGDMQNVNNYVYQYKTRQFVDSFASMAKSLNHITGLIHSKLR